MTKLKNEPKQNLILKAKLDKIIAKKELPGQQVKIIHRIFGGPPTEFFESVCQVSGNGKVDFTLKDETTFKGEKVYTSRLTEKEVLNFLKEIKNIKFLEVEETKPIFIPDSVVGSIGIEIDNVKKMYLYLADEDDRRHQKIILPMPIATIESAMKRIARRTIRRDEATLKSINSRIENDGTSIDSTLGKTSAGETSLRKMKFFKED